MDSLKISTFLAGMMLVVAVPAVAEEPANKSKVSASLGADLVSSYIWRGQDMGGFSIQPGFGIGYRGLSLGVWGSTGTDEEDTKEVDITLCYSFKGFTVGATDYWFDNGPGYFRYSAHNTAHVFEANVGYDFGPVALNWFTNFAGNDGLTSDGKRAYSSYVEVSAPFSLGGLDWGAEVGASPWSTTFYNSTGFAVVNIGLGVSREFHVGDSFGLRVFAKGICNPRNDKGYLLAGISFATL